MPDQPLVSVIMPAYNAAPFVRAAITSALAQTYEHIEVVVVDDGSTDATAEIVAQIARRDARVQPLWQANAGVAAARNFAIAHARGELIAPLDADDLWYPDKLERQVARLADSRSAVGLVYSACVRIDRGGRLIRPGQRWRVEGRVLAPLLMMNFIENASIPLMRRACVEEAGGYNVRRREQAGQGCEDWELALRIAGRHELAAVPDWLVAYRVMPGSMSSDGSSMGRGHALLMEDVASRHPELPAEVYRWSRAHFALYLAEVVAATGNGRGARRWLAEAVRSDPCAALSPWAVKTLLRSVGALPPVAGTPRRSRGLSERTAAPAASHNASRADGGGEAAMSPPPRADIVPAPPLWKRWMPYDRLCLARWRRLTGDRDPAL